MVMVPDHPAIFSAEVRAILLALDATEQYAYI
jgi:hypothetical protein